MTSSITQSINEESLTSSEDPNYGHPSVSDRMFAQFFENAFDDEPADV